MQADKMTDQLVAQAAAVKENLSSQRGTFSNISQRLASLRTRFPLIDSLMTSIYRRKMRDVVIVGLVICVCLIIVFFLMWK